MIHAGSFGDSVRALYAEHGPRNILPFIGPGYSSGAKQFRTCAIGFNSYISPEDWPAKDEDLEPWYPGWWENAGHGKSYRFFNAAYNQTDELSRGLPESPDFSDLDYDGNPRTKSGFYGTNVVKVYTEETHKRSSSLTPQDFEHYAPTWSAELDLMAEHGCLPHLMVVFGGDIWRPVLMPFIREVDQLFNFAHMRVLVYKTAENDSPCYHYVNRITAETASGLHTMMVVRMHHPSAQVKERVGAAWLLAQPEFRRLAGLSDLHP